jgi:hypothetical protein
MSEKTLRQVSDEAADHYSDYKREYGFVRGDIEHWGETVDAYAEQTQKEERKRDEAPVTVGAAATLENTIDWVGDWIGRLAYAAVYLEEAKENAGKVLTPMLEANAAHYRANQAAYHETAVIEAHLDGIEIKV